MKVVLIKNVPGLGQAGEVKEVREGYARNYLIPRGLADVLSKHGLMVLESRERKAGRLKAIEEKSKIKLAKKIDGKIFEINVKADNSGTIYAKIDSDIIIQRLRKDGYVVGGKEVVLREPIKKIGEYDIELNLDGNKAIIKLNIKRDEKEKS